MAATADPARDSAFQVMNALLAIPMQYARRRLGADPPD